jgi:predicted PurR-regulated permease PerM
MNARVVFALILVALALWTALSFLPSLIWATILAVALWPLYLKFATRFMAGPSAPAAFVFTLLVALVLVTPISLAVYTIAQQSDMLIDWMKRAREGGIEVPDWVARLPVAAESTQQWWRANLSDPKAATAWLKTLNADNVSDLSRRSAVSLSTACFSCFSRYWRCSCCCDMDARSPAAFLRHATVCSAKRGRV